MPALEKDNSREKEPDNSLNIQGFMVVNEMELERRIRIWGADLIGQEDLQLISFCYFGGVQRGWGQGRQ